MKVLLANPADNREEWSRIRRENKMLGASTAADVLGLTNRTPFQAFMSITGRTEALYDSQPLQAGRFLERGIAQWWAFETSSVLEDSPGMIQHPVLPFLACTPDFGFDERGVLEIKNRDRFAKDDWAEGIPLREMTQGQLYLEAWERTQGQFAVCFGGNELVRFAFERDDAFLSAVHDTLRAWYERHIVPDVAPAMTGTEDEIRAFRRLRAMDSGAVKQLDPGLQALAEMYRKLKAEIKERESALTVAQSALMQYADDASYLAMPDGSGFSFKAHEKVHKAKAPYIEKCRPFLMIQKVPL